MTEREEKDISLIISNEKEWRKHTLEEMRELRKTQLELLVTVSTLKVKVGFISGVFGAITGAIATVLSKKFGA